VTYTALALGSHTFEVRAIDDADNVDPTPASWTWTVGPVQPGQPDLVVSSIGDPPASAGQGSTFAVGSTTANQGTATAAASVTRFYLSADQVRDAGDRRLVGNRSVPELPAGESFPGDRVVTVPTDMALGVYYVLGCADDTALVAEASETNNCTSSTGTVTVTAPPDLVVSAMGDPPASRTQGSTFTVASTTANTGAGPAPASVTRFYLSADQVLDAGDRRMVGNRTVPELPAGASFTGNRVVTIPADMALGVYYVLGCADDTTLVTETDETNNCTSSTATVTVTAPPDLVVSVMGDPPASRTQASTFTIRSTTANLGPGPAPASVTRFYLSADQLLDAADRRMAGNRAVPELAAGESSTGNRVVTVPADMAPGVYFVLGCADDTELVAEVSETNNCRSSAARITVTPSG
jgi:subtilase family serine protease